MFPETPSSMIFGLVFSFEMYNLKTEIFVLCEYFVKMAMAD